MIITSTNYIAVIVTALIPLAVGFLWYSKIIFGNVWMKLEEVSKKEDEKLRKEPIAKKLLIAYLTYLLISYTLSILVNYLVVASIIPALILGALMWVGFIVPAAITDYLWSPKPKDWGLYYLHVGYFLISILLMSVVLALWI